MDKIIIFHGRPVEQRTCDLCGRVIYLEENMHRVRRRCRSYVKAYPMYISLNKICLKITDYWEGEYSCKHICHHCMVHNPDHPSIHDTDIIFSANNKEIISNIIYCMYTEDTSAIVGTYRGGEYSPPNHSPLHNTENLTKSTLKFFEKNEPKHLPLYEIHKILDEVKRCENNTKSEESIMSPLPYLDMNLLVEIIKGKTNPLQRRYNKNDFDFIRLIKMGSLE